MRGSQISPWLLGHGRKRATRCDDWSTAQATEFTGDSGLAGLPFPPALWPVGQTLGSMGLIWMMKVLGGPEDFYKSSQI